jgi:large subunit ribosomal protein L15
MAGVDKHKWSWAAKHFGSTYFGKNGFVRPGTVRVSTVNLYEINQKALMHQLEKKGGKFHFDFQGKVLGSGHVTMPLVIRAQSWSKNVEKKVGAHGGSISKLEGTS